MSSTTTVSVASRLPVELAEFIDSQIDESQKSSKDRAAVIRSMLFERAIAMGWTPADDRELSASAQLD